METPSFKPLITLEEVEYTIDEPYPHCDLLYRFRGNEIIVKKVDRWANKEPEQNFPIEEKFPDEKSILEWILTLLLSKSGNWYGYLNFISSPLFSEEEFKSFKEKARKNRIQKRDTEIESNSNNEIVLYCKEQGMSPNPDPDQGPGFWSANCPSGGQHHLYFRATTNEWFCGYCKRNGKLKELQEWINEKRLKNNQKTKGKN